MKKTSLILITVFALTLYPIAAAWAQMAVDTISFGLEDGEFGIYDEDLGIAEVTNIALTDLNPEHGLWTYFQSMESLSYANVYLYESDPDNTRFEVYGNLGSVFTFPITFSRGIDSLIGSATNSNGPVSPAGQNSLDIAGGDLFVEFSDSGYFMHILPGANGVVHPATGGPDPIPEPATVISGLLGLLGLAVKRFWK